MKQTAIKKKIRFQIIRKQQGCKKIAKSDIDKKSTEIESTNPLKPEHKIKCDILRSLGILSEATDLKRCGRNPLNFFYSELFISYVRPICTGADESLRSLIYPILANLGEQVEIDYLHWDEIKSSDNNLKGNIRQKMDLMLWRIRTRLISECLLENIKGITVQLQILGDYLHNCRTRVMSTQVADVCLELLLKIKIFLVLGPIPDSKNFERLELCHALLFVFDVIMERNLFAPLNDMLLTTFVSKQETFD